MTNYGFVIDNRKCIGCHACTTACKQENEVPLSVNRTWVKYVETGAYPDTRRNFQVTRCNHCANPPCARICPVTAMYQRKDGIVEFDPAQCIGCKACVQACPYDAIYIDPEDGTAAKCHFCAHRTDIGLEPACVVVCPEHAIIAGDMDDPYSEISQILGREQVTVRKPEQGTSPKLFYINGNDVSLHPTATQRTPESFVWADVIPLEGIPVVSSANGHSAAAPKPARTASSGVELRQIQAQGYPEGGPIKFAEGKMADHMVQVAYNQQHKIPWHWPVPAYLVTKGIGAGAFMLLALGSIFGFFPFERGAYLMGGFLSLAFIGITTGLLVYDLERPERFLKILLRPQWKSWLTRGSFILIGFTAIVGLWWVAEAAASLGFVGDGLAELLRAIAMPVGGLLAVGAAVYTAFLFGQAEGRDLWQSPLLPPHLLTQAIMVGAGALLIAGLIVPLGDAMTRVVAIAFGIAIVVDAVVTLMGEFGMPHASEVAATAAHEITSGKYRLHFWMGGVLVGHALPLLMIALGGAWGALGGLCAIAGLYFYEYAYVMAPQEVPNS